MIELWEGFESEQDSNIKGFKFTQVGGTFQNVNTIARRQGGRSALLSANGSSTFYARLTRDMKPTTQKTIGIGVRFGRVSPKNLPFMRIGNGAQAIELLTDESNRLAVKHSDTNVILGVSEFSLAPLTWYYIQAMVDLTAGSVSACIGTREVISLAGLNIPILNNLLTTLTFQAQPADNIVLQLWLDDLYVADNRDPATGYLGVVSIYGALPNADGDVMTFKRNGGSDSPYKYVNEPSASVLNYLYGDDIDAKATFKMSPVPQGQVIGANLFAYVARSDQGSGISKYKLLLRAPDGSEYLSEERVLSSAPWTTDNLLLFTNPFTNAPLTADDLNALQPGILVTQVE